MSTNINVIDAFIALSPRDKESKNLCYNAYYKSIFSYAYKIGYWLYVPNKGDHYAVIRAHDDYAPSKTTATHMNTLFVRSGCIRSMTLPILTPKLFDNLPDCKGEPGWDSSYYPLYRAAVVKAARTKTKIYFDVRKQQMREIIENLDKIATTFGWSYSRDLYTVENVLADNQKLLEQFALRDMGVWN